MAGLSGKLTPGVDNGTSLREYGRLLARLDEIPANNQTAIFATARASFSAYRQRADQSTLDSLYVMCSTEGAKAVVAFTNTKDAQYHQRAIDWYLTAYALKPYPALKNRITRLQTAPLPLAHAPEPLIRPRPALPAASAKPKQTRKPAKKPRSPFVLDSEVNP